MSKDKKRLVPVRRFKEFENAPAWEQRKFMDLIDSIIDFRGRTPKKLGMNWSNEGLLALSAQNVKDGYIDKTIDAHYGSQTLYDKWMNGRELHKGQVVFTTEAPMGNVARIPDENKYILSQRTIAFTVKNTVLTEGFLMYLLESPSVKNNLLRISSGGTAKGVSQKTLSSLTVKIPTSLKEQERINFVFYSLDSLITLHQRKLDKLKRVKSAYLTEMFPAEGEREPKRRFPGFTVAWEQRKLGEVADVRDGTHDSPRYINEGYPLLTSKNVGNGYINYDDVKYVSENDYVQINKRSKVDINDILMGMIGTIGNLALIREEPDFAIKNVALIKHTSNFDYQFLFQELQTSAISKELLSGMDGGTQKFVSLKKIRNLSVMLPSENEQKQIGAFFKQFDSLIALHQRKLDKLKKMKAAYLEEMFV